MDRITKKVLEGLVKKLNLKFADALARTGLSRFVLDGNSSYTLPYQLYLKEICYQTVGPRMTAKEMYAYLRGLLGYYLPTDLLS